MIFAALREGSAMFEKKSDADSSKELREMMKLLEKLETRIIKMDTRQQVIEQEVKDLKKIIKKG